MAAAGFGPSSSIMRAMRHVVTATAVAALVATSVPRAVQDPPAAAAAAVQGRGARPGAQGLVQFRNIRLKELP
jgi:hypothetical protein